MHEHTNECLNGCTYLAAMNKMLVDASICAYCNEQKPDAQQVRYSAGVYAGRMCDDCAYRKYRDHCGVDGTPQLTQADVDEPIEAEECFGGNDLAEYGM